MQLSSWNEDCPKHFNFFCKCLQSGHIVYYTLVHSPMAPTPRKLTFQSTLAPTKSRARTYKTTSTYAKAACNDAFAIGAAESTGIGVLDAALLGSAQTLLRLESKNLEDLVCVQGNQVEYLQMLKTLKQRVAKCRKWEKVDIVLDSLRGFIESPRFGRMMSNPKSAVFHDGMSTWDCPSAWGTSTHSDCRAMLEKFANAAHAEELLLGVTVSTRNAMHETKIALGTARDVVTRDTLEMGNHLGLTVELVGSCAYTSMFFMLARFSKRRVSMQVNTGGMPTAVVPMGSRNHMGVQLSRCDDPASVTLKSEVYVWFETENGGGYFYGQVTRIGKRSGMYRVEYPDTGDGKTFDDHALGDLWMCLRIKL